MQLRSLLKNLKSFSAALFVLLLTTISPWAIKGLGITLTPQSYKDSAAPDMLTYRVLVSMAKNAIDRGNFTDAHDLLLKAKKLAPKYHDIAYYEGVIAEKEGNLRLAEQFYNNFLESGNVLLFRDTLIPEAHYHMARIYKLENKEQLYRSELEGIINDEIAQNRKIYTVESSLRRSLPSIPFYKIFSLYRIELKNSEQAYFYLGLLEFENKDYKDASVSLAMHALSVLSKSTSYMEAQDPLITPYKEMLVDYPSTAHEQILSFLISALPSRSDAPYTELLSRAKGTLELSQYDSDLNYLLSLGTLKSIYYRKDAFPYQIFLLRKNKKTSPYLERSSILKTLFLVSLSLDLSGSVSAARALDADLKMVPNAAPWSQIALKNASKNYAALLYY